MEKIDAKHIRGEFKVWIYHHYLAPSFHYFLAVNQTSTTRIQNLEAVATRKMKCYSSAAVPSRGHENSPTQYHKIKRKTHLPHSNHEILDPLLHQLQELLVSNYAQQHLEISTLFKDYFEFPISQILTTPKKNLTNKIDKRLKERCNEHLSDLKVQSKFKEITILESECHSWKKIVQSGLPHGKLSFLLRAGSDSLPHPANLCRWNIQCVSKCPLCSST